MLMSFNDPVVNSKRDELIKRHVEMRLAYAHLPWWRKLSGHEDRILREKIHKNWAEFSVWQIERVADIRRRAEVARLNNNEDEPLGIGV